MLESTRDKFGAAGISIAVRRQQQHQHGAVDAEVEITYGGRKRSYQAVIKRNLRREALGAVFIEQRMVGEGYLLIADHVPPPLAERLRLEGIQFLDAAGNAYLRDHDLLIWIDGRRPLQAFVRREKSRVSTPTGLKVLFAILSRPDLLKGPMRAVAAAADAALGSVHIVMRELAQRGHLMETKSGRRLVNAGALVREWADGYVAELRPRILLGRFRAQDPAWWRDIDIRKYSAVWGGEVAASLLVRYLRPHIVTVFAPELPTRLMIDGRLQRDDSGTVEIRRRFWKFDLDWEHRDVAPPLLVYADLLASGDSRSADAARDIDSAYVARSLSKV